jgi:hypothetical protein
MGPQQSIPEFKDEDVRHTICEGIPWLPFVETSVVIFCSLGRIDVSAKVNRDRIETGLGTLIRGFPMRSSIQLCLLTLLLVAGQADAQQCVDLQVGDDGTGQSIGIVLSEISPGNFIELFNFSGADIDLASETFFLCSPFNYTALSVLSSGNSVIPAGGYLTVPWPANFTDLDGGGEIILYSTNSFGASSAVMDFVCWGTNPHSSRKALAETALKWVGTCATALSASSLTRIVAAGSNGTSKTDYDTVSPATPVNCSPNSVPSMSRWGLLAAVLVATFAILRRLKGATAAPGV